MPTGKPPVPLAGKFPAFMGLFYGKVIEQQMMDFPAMCDYQRLDIFNQRYTVPYPHCRPSRIALRRGPMLICKPMQAPPRQAEKRSNDSTLACILRKPASWLVAVCERSENRGCGGGGWLPKGNEISPCPCVEREKTEHFAGLCTTRQFADVWVSIPPRSAFLVAGETMRMYWKIQWNCRRTW